jgi:hypothetical protein
MRELVELDREFQRKFHPQNPLGFTKLITALLALMNILSAAAIVGGVVMYGRVTSLNDKVDLIIQGRIRVP